MNNVYEFCFVESNKCDWLVTGCSEQHAVDKNVIMSMANVSACFHRACFFQNPSICALSLPMCGAEAVGGRPICALVR